MKNFGNFSEGEGVAREQRDDEFIRGRERLVACSDDLNTAN